MRLAEADLGRKAEEQGGNEQPAANFQNNKALNRQNNKLMKTCGGGRLAIKYKNNGAINRPIKQQGVNAGK